MVSAGRHQAFITSISFVRSRRLIFHRPVLELRKRGEAAKEKSLMLGASIV